MKKDTSKKDHTDEAIGHGAAAEIGAGLAGMAGLSITEKPTMAERAVNPHLKSFDPKLKGAFSSLHKEPDGFFGKLIEKFRRIGSYAYDPINHTVLSSSGKVDPDVIGHEIGHAANWKKIKNLFNNEKLYHGFVYGSAMYNKGAQIAAAPIAAGLSDVDNEMVSKMSPYAGLILTSPQLLDEGMASARHLKNVKGLGAKLRAASKLGPAYLTYMAPAIGGAVAANYVRSKKQEEKETALKKGFKKAASCVYEL